MFWTHVDRSLDPTRGASVQLFHRELFESTSYQSATIVEYILNKIETEEREGNGYK
jgi:hypothetical protein